MADDGGAAGGQAAGGIHMFLSTADRRATGGISPLTLLLVSTSAGGKT